MTVRNTSQCVYNFFVSGSPVRYCRSMPADPRDDVGTRWCCLSARDEAEPIQTDLWRESWPCFASFCPFTVLVAYHATRLGVTRPRFVSIESTRLLHRVCVFRRNYIAKDFDGCSATLGYAKIEWRSSITIAIGSVVLFAIFSSSCCRRLQLGRDSESEKHIWERYYIYREKGRTATRLRTLSVPRTTAHW